MSTYIIPTEDAAALGNFDLSVDLDGSDYLLSFQLNSREGFWYWSLIDIIGNELRSGSKVVSNYPLLHLLKTVERPPGELFCFDTRVDPTDPGLEDLGVNAEFGYADQAEVEEA